MAAKHYEDGYVIQHSMGMTIAEKILARCSGKSQIKPGDITWIEPDLIGACNMREPSTSVDSIAPDIQSLLGISGLKHPERIAVFLDRADPPRTPADAEFQNQVRQWCYKYSVQCYEGNRGLSFMSMIEMGILRPGMLLAHHDTEVTLVGGIGALAIGTLPLLEIYTTGETWLEVPETIRFDINGDLPCCVLGRDVMHFIMSQIGPERALSKIIEFGGSAVEKMSIDSRITLCSMANHFGAESGIVNPDQKAIDFVKTITKKSFDPVISDPDAKYREVYSFDVTNLEPYIASPPDVFHTGPLSEMQGIPIQHGYIGSCGGGRLEDLRAAATILRGRKVHPSVKLLVVPNTPAILQAASEEGLLKTLIQAGAFISSPSCNYCSGHYGTLGADETTIATGVMNNPGRMGSESARIYLANAYVIAASAIEGKIADPGKFL